jgi:hypothetical protein
MKKVRMKTVKNLNKEQQSVDLFIMENISFANASTNAWKTCARRESL